MKCTSKFPYSASGLSFGRIVWYSRIRYDKIHCFPKLSAFILKTQDLGTIITDRLHVHNSKIPWRRYDHIAMSHRGTIMLQEITG